MDVSTPEGLLEALMQARPLTPAELDAFLAANQGEGQLYDYKSGDLTAKANRAAGLKTIREYVTGFANAEGGVLIIGVQDARPHVVDGCKPIGTEALTDWAQKALVEVAGMFSPVPRFSTVAHSCGDVLLIATERAPQLIPCIQAGKLTYHLRVNTSTIQVPEYLLSDLLVGRRRHAVLDLTLDGIGCVVDEDRYESDVQLMIGCEFNLTLENRSLVRALNVEVGVVGLTECPERVPVNGHILTFVDVVQPTWSANRHQWYPTIIACRNHPYAIDFLPPFERRAIQRVKGITLPGNPDGFYRCAIYLMPEGLPPRWFQLEMDTDGQVGPGLSRTFTPSFRRLVPLGRDVRPTLEYLVGEDAIKAMAP
ncbi:MAG: ATP-binding protein [Holophagales bacterium]|jgi:hypothetical protein|nr:ATP-binding protein [Holophagales bacterium]